MATTIAFEDAVAICIECMPGVDAVFPDDVQVAFAGENIASSIYDGDSSSTGIGDHGNKDGARCVRGGDTNPHAVFPRTMPRGVTAEREKRLKWEKERECV